MVPLCQDLVLASVTGTTEVEPDFKLRSHWQYTCQWHMESLLLSSRVEGHGAVTGYPFKFAGSQKVSVAFNLKLKVKAALVYPQLPPTRGANLRTRRRQFAS
jgi:hypothetical protein